VLRRNVKERRLQATQTNQPAEPIERPRIGDFMRQTSIFLNSFLSAGALAFGMTAPAMAQVSQDSGIPAEDAAESDVGLVDIVVTATKREQSLQDVPASVSAVSGERLTQTDIGQLSELTGIVPNFQIQRDPIGDRINIRGIQSGNNAGLEQSVSTFVDGVYRGRGVQTRFAFLDLARVEVLRGPQGTLFGKNTIGGALNLTTARPTRAFKAELGAGYTFDGVREANFDGFVSGPISDSIRFRLAGTYSDLSRGHLRNAFYGGKSTPKLKEFALRGTIEADLDDVTLVTARYEHGDFDQFGQPFGIRVGGPLTPILAAFGAPADGRKAVAIGSINPVLNIGSSGNHNGKSDEASLTLTREIGSGTLTAIGAYSSYDFKRQLDADFSPVDVVRFDDSEDFEQGSVEIRYASDPDRPLHFIVGGYYQYNTLVATGDSQFNVCAAPVCVGPALSPAPAPTPTPPPGGPSARQGALAQPQELAIDTLLAGGCAAATAAGANPATDRNCILSGLISGFNGTPLAYTDFGRFLVLDQKDKVAALFGEVTYRINDKISVTGGLRYSYEKKTGTQTATATNFGTRVRNPLTGNQAAYLAATGMPGLDPFQAIGEGAEHAFVLGRKENSLTYSAGIQFEPNKDTLLYAKISSGFKAGGFNSFALSASPAEAEFEDESATGIEAGAKLKFFDNRATLNVAAFRTKFKDIQTAVFTGSTSFIVQNAAAATSTGLELDGRLAVTDRLTLGASAAYVDFKYDSFPNAACTVDQLFQFRTDTGQPLATIQDCSQAFRNDLKGRTSENTPKYSGSANFSYVLPIAGFTLTTIGDLLFQSKQFRDSDLDPTLIQRSYAKVNMSLIFGPEDGQWDLSVIGKNIFDKKTFTYGSDTPLLEGARQFAPDRPRTIAVRARARF
jgi:iron complex outermembrane recepter protein